MRLLASLCRREEEQNAAAAPGLAFSRFHQRPADPSPAKAFVDDELADLGDRAVVLERFRNMEADEAGDLAAALNKPGLVGAGSHEPLEPAADGRRLGGIAELAKELSNPLRIVGRRAPESHEGNLRAEE